METARVTQETEWPVRLVVHGQVASLRSSKSKKKKMKRMVRDVFNDDWPKTELAISRPVRLNLFALLDPSTDDVDVDNFCKPIMDALTDYAWDDDKQVVDLHARKANLGEDFEIADVNTDLFDALATQKPFVLIEIWPIDQLRIENG